MIMRTEEDSGTVTSRLTASCTAEVVVSEADARNLAMVLSRLSSNRGSTVRLERVLRSHHSAHVSNTCEEMMGRLAVA